MTHDKWWYKVGSGIRPLPNEDFEEFSKRVTRIAWDASVAAEREACAKVCDEIEEKCSERNQGRFPQDCLPDEVGAEICAVAIRARGQE